MQIPIEPSLPTTTTMTAAAAAAAAALLDLQLKFLDNKGNCDE